MDKTAARRFPVQVRPNPARRFATIWLALLLAVVTTPLVAMAGHVQDANAATPIRPRITGIKPLTKEVYGYLPYWRLDSTTVDHLQYDLVSTIAFFGLGILANGNIDTSWVGYKEYVGDDAAAVTNAAHDKGVRVVPTFQLFDGGALHKMTAFLGSDAAQATFIAQALDLMAARKADGANLDFEPMPASMTPAYLTFVAKLRTAMRTRFPGSTLVNSTSAGAGADLVAGLVPLVDKQMIMTYGYRTATATVAGAVAPLASAARNVNIHITRILKSAPADSILLGVPYYGFDWPVTSAVPNATVQTDKTTYGAAKSITYAAARDYLAAHPTIVRHHDTVEGSAFYIYRDSVKKTYREVYFDDERSLGAKYDYALVQGLGGIGIWTLDNDKGYTALWNVLRQKFYAPVRSTTITASISDLHRTAGVVWLTVHGRVRNTGTVPLTGRWWWSITDPKGHIVTSGKWAPSTIYPTRSLAHGRVVRLGLASSLRAGTYTLRIYFKTASRSWRSPVVGFRQPY
jgi:spore germination protein YaaH